MKNIIVVAGAPACGKSVAKNRIGDFLESDGYSVVHMSDKEALLRVISRDMVGRQPNADGSLESEHSILLDPSKPRESWGIVFKTAKALNEAHLEMFEGMAYLAKEQPNTIVLAEIAYGQNVEYPGGPLRQSAGDYVTQFTRLGIVNRMLILDIKASLSARRPRNQKREIGPIPDSEFVKYFGDGGGFGDQETRLLNNGYHAIDNERIRFEQYTSKLEEEYHGFIAPGIRGEGHVQREKGW